MLFVLIDEPRRQDCISFIKALTLTTKQSVEIKKYKKNRSLAQNRTYWLWLGIIGEFNGDSPEDLHELFKLRFLGHEEKTIMGESVTLVRSTAKLTTLEFGEYLVKVEMLAKQLGIVLPYPDDYRDT